MAGVQWVLVTLSLSMCGLSVGLLAAPTVYFTPGVEYVYKISALQHTDKTADIVTTAAVSR